ncbi:MAG TPA: hypothetical protein VMX35_12895 [Acidobacteriota bacterium]|nr:hypothetical protein [Acidobacteriota bacterium]
MKPIITTTLVLVCLSIPGFETSAQDEYAADFHFVQENIGFEAYRGSMKGAGGVLLEGAGNSLDRALLLAQRLNAKGMTTRIAHGRLRGDALERVVRLAWGIDASESGASLNIDADLKKELVNLVVDHYWVQMASGKNWLDLDPTLPESTPGRSIAPLFKFYETLPAHLQQCFELEIHSDFSVGGDLAHSRLLRYVGPVSRLLVNPVTLLFAHQDADGAYRYSETGGFRPVLIEGGIVHPAINLEAAVSRAAEHRGGVRPNLNVKRVWMELAVIIPGEETKAIQRQLYSENEPADSRLGELVVISLADWRSLAGRLLADSADLRAAAQTVADLRSPTFPQSLSNQDQAAINELLRVQRELCRSMGALLAAQLTETAGLLGDASGSPIRLQSPHVLAFAIDPRKGKARTDILELAGISLPRSGADALDSAATLFAFGVAASAQEGLLMRQLPGSAAEDSISATLSTAQRESDWLAVDRSGIAQLDQYRLSDGARRSMEAALTRGKILILPRSADPGGIVWWELDPESGGVLGMIEPGIGGATQDLPSNWSDIASAYAPGFYSTWHETLASLSRAASMQLGSRPEEWRRAACLIIPDAVPVLHDIISAAINRSGDLELSRPVSELFSPNGRLRLQAIISRFCR